MASLLNIDGDSSEEDEEELLPSVSVSTATLNGRSSQPETSSKPAVVLLHLDDAEDDLEDELEDEPLMEIGIGGPGASGSASAAASLPSGTAPAQAVAAPKVASQDFIDALQSVTANCWDVVSWGIFLEEVRARRNGSMTIPAAYAKFLHQFPRAFHVWKELAEYHAHTLGDLGAAEEIYRKQMLKCRDVSFWQSYASFVRFKHSGGASVAHSSSRVVSIEELSTQRKHVEAAFELGIEHVGMLFDSYPLWRAYIDYIRELPDAAGSVAATESSTVAAGSRKVVVLRKIYQRAVSTAMEHLDELWKEYEAMERSLGEQFADKVLPEHKERVLHAKTIFRDRRSMTSNIDFNGLAVPPTRTLGEMQQLDSWNKWLKFEMTNPDNLPPTSFKAHIKMIYERCLSCLLYHPEIWLSWANFELEQGASASATAIDTTSLPETASTIAASTTAAGGILEARSVYREAIDNVPKVALLRVALAELEEKLQNFDSARETLRAAFLQIPSGFTFAVLQRFIRRREGIEAARKLFAETYTMRQDKKQQGLEIYLANAQLELDTNACAEVALKVIDKARAAYPQQAGLDLRVVRTQIRALLRLGDLAQLQWVMQSATTEYATLIQAINASFLDGSNSISNNESAHLASFDLPVLLRDQLFLWEEYLYAEMLLGLSDAGRLDDLRRMRDQAKSMFENNIHNNNSRDKDRDRDNESHLMEERHRGVGLFKHSFELSERYHACLTCPLPINDERMRERSRGRRLIEELAKLESERMQAMREANVRNNRRQNISSGGSSNSGDPANVASAAMGAGTDLAGIPYVLREFLTQLPSSQHSSSGAGPLPDVELFMRHLKTMVLPPRPLSDNDSGGGGGGSGGDGGKRDASMAAVAASNDWMTAASGLDVDQDEDYDRADNSSSKNDDIFRRRQRMRLLL